MHGGAAGSGAPAGNTNALKHGMFTRKAIEERKALFQMILETEAFLNEIDE
jgi:glucans biosynthesis protein